MIEIKNVTFSKTSIIEGDNVDVNFKPEATDIVQEVLTNGSTNGDGYMYTIPIDNTIIDITIE